MLYLAYGFWVLFWPALGGFSCCLASLLLATLFPTQMLNLLRIGLAVQTLLAAACMCWLLSEIGSLPASENRIFVFVALLLLLGSLAATAMLRLGEQREHSTARLTILRI